MVSALSKSIMGTGGPVLEKFQGTEMGLQFSLRSSYHAERASMGETSETLVCKIQLLADRGCYHRITKDGSWHSKSKLEM